MIQIGAITVIDAPCGAGKTSWAIRQINRDPDGAYIFCTPFLDQIARIRSACGPERFHEPTPRRGTKLADFNRLLALGQSIAVTHVTFLNATEETLEHIRAGGYTLILDEAADVVCEFNKTPRIREDPRQFVSREDLGMLFEKKLIEVTDGFRVVWRGGRFGPEFKFYEVMRAAEQGRLYCARDSLLLTVFPPEVFRQFKQTWVLTYMLDGSLMKPYFRLFGLEYSLAGVRKTPEGHELTEYRADADAGFRRSFKEKVHLCADKALDRPRTLSKAWYQNASPAQLKQLKNDLANYFNHKLKGARSGHGDVMWTCPADYESALSGKGYTMVRRMTAAEKAQPEPQRKETEKALNCFVPCNARATNLYRDRWALAYCCNMFYPPLLRAFFVDRGVVPDEEAYATASLIQWICRSRIRDGGPVELYLPAKRMRELLLRWMA